MGIKVSAGERCFRILNIVGMILFCICAIYPFLYLLTRSLSPSEVSLVKIGLLPERIVFDNYWRVLKNPAIGAGFKNSIIRTCVGSAVNVAGAILGAYPLSKKYFPNRNFWTAFVVVTMFFGGGLIPSYVLVKQLGLMNSMWAMILPGSISTYNMIIMRNFFMSVPESLEEAARIDGANDFKILWRVILPISKPILMTVLLWSLVGHWNAWFDCLIYITHPSKQVLQVVLRRIVMEGAAQMLNPNSYDFADNEIVNPENIKAATIMVATIPIIMVYPFLQKHFVKGILVGSLKG